MLGSQVTQDAHDGRHLGHLGFRGDQLSLRRLAGAEVLEAAGEDPGDDGRWETGPSGK